MRLLPLTVVFLLHLAHRCFGVEGSEYPYWPYVTEHCSDFPGKSCDLRCKEDKKLDCSQYCHKRKHPCKLHCPKIATCYQECHAGELCQRLNCEAKSCTQECIPSCGEMRCNSDTDCYQRIGNESFRAVFRTKASCSGRFCSQSCEDKLCDVTCDKAEWCRQRMRNTSQAVCNARVCEQSCELGDCVLECQKDSPSNYNCTQYTANAFYEVVLTDEETTENGWEKEEPEKDESGTDWPWGGHNLTMEYNSTIAVGMRSVEWRRRTDPIRATAKCYSRQCLQWCLNGTCIYNCENSEICHQQSRGERTEMKGRCSAENCTQTCWSSGSCDFTCQGKNCNMTCLGQAPSSSTCRLRCLGDNVEDCQMRCEGYSQCMLDCGNAKRCSHSGQQRLHSQSTILQVVSAIFALNYVFMKI